MSIYDVLRQNPGWPAGLLPKPDRAFYQDALFTNTWLAVRGMDGLGDANFEVPATGNNTSGGLRVFLQGTLAGAAGAGYVASLETGTPAAVTIDEDAKTIVIVAPATGTLGNVKTVVDAETQLTSVYFDDGVAANTAGRVAAHAVRDGHAPRGAVVRVHPNGEGFYYVGASAPDSDIAMDSDTGVDGVVMKRTGDVALLFAVPPGERLFLRRRGNANAAGAMELWK